MSTFQADATAAILPILARYNLSSASLTPAGGSAFSVAVPVLVPLTASPPTFYVDGIKGSDTNDGKTPTTAWKSIKIVDKSIVVLAAGQSFTKVAGQSWQFNGHVNATLTTDPTNPATLSAPAGDGTDIIEFWTNSIGCTLQNVILDSADGNGFAGTVRGPDQTIDNVRLKNLNEGLHYINACTNLTISNGGQIGAVKGRCHYLLDVVGGTWTGNTSQVFGPASSQSPIRFSCPGVRNFTITGVRVTQVGSTFPIACWAIHSASNVRFIDCEANGGQFSFDTAQGIDIAGVVTGCTITRLNCVNTQIALRPAGQGNQFVDCTAQYTPAEPLSLDGSKGNTFTNLTLISSFGGVHFYATGTDVISSSTYNSQGNTKAAFFNGAFTAANQGAGNKVAA